MGEMIRNGSYMKEGVTQEGDPFSFFTVANDTAENPLNFGNMESRASQLL